MAVLVVKHNLDWSDAERKNKEQFWMHRLKSFRPEGMDKLSDFTNMDINKSMPDFFS